MSPVAPRRGGGLMALSPVVLVVGAVAVLSVVFALLVGVGIMVLVTSQSKGDADAA